MDRNRPSVGMPENEMASDLEAFMPRLPRMRTALLAACVGFVCLALSALPAAAEECSWGQPGYRDCMDRKIEQLRKEEAGKEPRQVRKTVPASKRPGTLTPDIMVRETPRNRIPANTDYGDGWNPERAQRQFNRNQSGIQQHLVPPIQLPPSRQEMFPVPGRICPPAGCM